MDSAGRFRIEYNGQDIDMGSLEEVNQSFYKQVNTTPIATMSMDRAIAIETGSGLNISVRFNRNQPENVNNSSSRDTVRYSNAAWYKTVDSAVNRWQARTDGFHLTYEPDNPYIPPMDRRGYIKSLSRTYNMGFNTLITGHMEFHVGRMSVTTENPSETESRPTSGFSIYMTDGKGQIHYLLNGNDPDSGCVESYKLSGGMENPFEFIRMTVSRSKMESLSPGLADSITPGETKLTIVAVGTSMDMVVVKSKLNGNKKYSITAYCGAEVLRGMVTSSAITIHPRKFIDDVLTTGSYGGVLFRRGSTFITNVADYVEPEPEPPAEEEGGTEDDGTTETPEEEEPVQEDPMQVSFEKGTNIWYALQVCATMLGAKLYFADNRAYLIDYRSIPDGSTVHMIHDLDLYTMNMNDPMYARIVGQPILGDEGVDTVINNLNLRCTSKGATTTKEFTDDDSYYRFKERSQTLSVPLTEEQAELFAEGLFAYRREPTQSVTFTVREFSIANGALSWKPFFDTVTAANSITSKEDDFTVTNKSLLTGGRHYPKLLLSSYERSYPEGTTTYVFGLAGSIDLASSTSQILTALDN